MTNYGFGRSKYDYCLYVRKENGLTVYILLFVDDLLTCCENEEFIVEIKNKLSERFRIKDMVKVKNYIGIEIEYNYSKENVLTLSQKSFINFTDYLN